MGFGPQAAAERSDTRSLGGGRGDCNDSAPLANPQ